MSKISINKLAAEIAEGLKEFSQDVVERVDVSSERIGKAAVKKLKQTSPKDKGDYAKGWAMTTEKELAQPNRRIIHNKKHYRLVHLLEHGHVKVGGGRVKAIPHVAPAEEEVVQDFTREVEEAIRRG